MRRKTEAAARVPGNVLYGRRTILYVASDQRKLCTGISSFLGLDIQKLRDDLQEGRNMSTATHAAVFRFARFLSELWREQPSLDHRAVLQALVQAATAFL
jgi:hypothetical protein